MTAHIARTVMPPNADPTRTHLNKNLMEFPEGVKDRTEAIRHRLENAGLERKIGKNQVQVIRVMLTGSHDDMKLIEAEGRLGDWCRDNLEWLAKTFGRENVVSATLHMDEDTPHIHASVVPIVTGERRKKKSNKPESPEKKQYRKKNREAPRLCADDVMARDKLKSYQDSYAVAMQKYGLQRGIEGSEARHISTQQYYRDLVVKSEDLKETVGILQEQKEEVNDKIRDLYDRKNEAREKFLNMDEYVRRKEKEVADMETRLNQLQKDYEPYKAQDDLNTLLEVFPQIAESLRMTQLCRSIGLAVDTIKKLFTGEAIPYTGKLRSLEHDRDFSVQDGKLQFYKEKDNPNKLHLSLNGKNIIDWFKKQLARLNQTTRTIIRPVTRENKGIKM